MYKRRLQPKKKWQKERPERGVQMKEYEAIREIINQCPLNYSRDQLFEEIECEDPEQYIQEKFLGKDFRYEKTVQSDGTQVFDIFTAGIHQRYTFSEI